MQKKLTAIYILKSGLENNMIIWPVCLTETKYSKWYSDLMAKSKIRTLTGYTEKHHIIPRSFGGSDDKDNIAVLTAREHYIAHWLLWKMKFSQPYSGKMAHAFATFFSRTFTKDRSIHHNYNLNSRTYEKVKTESAAYISENFSGENAAWYGRKHTEESKKIIGEKSKLKTFKSGPDNPRWGQKMPPGFSEKIAAINKEKWNDPEWRAAQTVIKKEISNRPEVKEKHAAFHKERWARMDIDERKSLLDKSLLKAVEARQGKTWEEIYTPEQIERMHDARVNRVISEDAKSRMRAGLEKGCRAPMPEHVKKQMSERMKGRTDMVGEGNGMYGKKHSLESIEKMKESHKNRPITECPHCGKQSRAKSQMVRWHNDNCKHKK